MLKEIIGWWVERMLEFLPERLQHIDMASSSALTISVPDVLVPMSVTILQSRRGQGNMRDCFVLDEHGRSRIRALTRSSKHRVAHLHLPPSCLLERTLLLPAAAGRDVAGVLGYEIDRVTPFNAAEIFWRYTVEHRHLDNGRLKVRLSLIPKAPWQPLLIALAESGIAIATIKVPRQGGRVCRIDVDRDISRHEKWARRRLVCVAGFYGTITVATVLLPFLLQLAELHAVERQIAALRPNVAEAGTLLEKIGSSTNGIDVMVAEEASAGDVLTVLRAVTEELPDDTYLTSLSLRQGKLSMSGQSAVSAKLLSALSNNKLIRNAAFAAPTVRADQAKMDVFSIRAEVDPVGSTSRPGSTR